MDTSVRVGEGCGEFKFRNISPPVSRILWSYFDISKSQLLHWGWFRINPDI
jgi:hypothetical protein